MASFSQTHSTERRRRNPCARMPHSRKTSNSALTIQGKWPYFAEARISGLGVPGGMALHGQALGHSLLFGVPQENARYRPLFLCESENWANEVLVDPGARAG